ncbi:uncharacterized protein K441DRAFT_664029 [Cenococcum geophilum 1.58]|uniref:uncharacterized protein n=1 Tax=Cenococcum geophilum 1.58 TaxID=794803 RepID=UPI00359026ED|nr:hypothetical protein K441DRAFT_664029 [Cenococcum geophilum 1.58]
MATSNFQFGAAINLDAVQAVQSIWGTAVAVFNFFSKSSMQPSAVVYAANCSIVGGESEGWKLTLQSLSLRSTTGTVIGTLRIGYPGSGFLPHLVNTQFGPRWLGILAALAIATTEHQGARELHRLLKAIANAKTTQYLLDEEQTEKMWLMGRELFLASPVQIEFQSIVSRCQQSSKTNLVSAAYPDSSTESFTPMMSACFRAWEMANSMHKNQQQYLGAKIHIQGSNGFGQLILYLTVVCGFRVTARLDQNDVEFGDENSPTNVVVVFDREVGSKWQTGYLMDNHSIEESVQHWLGGDRESSMVLWRPGASAFAPVHPGLYSCSTETIEANNSINLVGLTSLKKQLWETGNGMYVSMWLMNYLHTIIRNTQLLAIHRSLGSQASVSAEEIRTPSRDRALAGRLRIALTVFNPDLIDPEHINLLFKRIADDESPTPLSPLPKSLPKEKSKLLCDCEAHASPMAVCKFLHISMMLEEFAWKIWICAHLDIKSHALLRDMGPITEWNVMNQLGMMSGGYEMIPAVIPTQTLLSCVATRLAGRLFNINDENIMGLAAGGAVSGLRSNEDKSLLTDPGYCLYTVPGSMETPQRRVKEMYQFRFAGSGFGRWSNAMELSDVQRPIDKFGSCQFEHVVDVLGDKATIQTSVRVGEKSIGVDIIKAINSAATVRFWDGCLGKCAQGCLTEAEIRQVQVADGTNYGSLVQLAGPNQKELPKLTVVLAHNNLVIERAVVSHQTRKDVCMIQRGDCTHCAVRAALIEGAKVLLD